MKVLYKTGEWQLGIFDDKNFYIAKEKIVQEGKSKGQVRQSCMKYFPTVEMAVLKLCDSVSMSECKSLRDLVSIHRQTALDVSKQLSMDNSLTT